MNLILVKRDSRLSLSRSLGHQGERSTLQDHIPLTGHEGSGLGCSKVGLEQVGKHLPFPTRSDSSRCSEILKIYKLWLCYCSLLDVLELVLSPSGKVPKLDSLSRKTSFSSNTQTREKMYHENPNIFKLRSWIP